MFAWHCPFVEVSTFRDPTPSTRTFGIFDKVSDLISLDSARMCRLICAFVVRILHKTQLRTT